MKGRARGALESLSMRGRSRGALKEERLRGALKEARLRGAHGLFKGRALEKRSLGRAFLVHPPLVT
jgi:hypothetical protein